MRDSRTAATGAPASRTWPARSASRRAPSSSISESKEALFLEAFKRAVSLLPAWLDAPADVVEQGFWAVLDWWLQQAEELVAPTRCPTGSR